MVLGLILKPQSTTPPMCESNDQSRPILFLTICPKIDDDCERFQQALNDLARRDPTVRIATEVRDGRIIVCGMGESQLKQVCDHIRQEFNAQFDVSGPTVIYLETIRKPSVAEGKYIRQTGGAGNYGHVKIQLEPNGSGKGFEFINDIKDGHIPGRYFPSIERGIRETMLGGILGGYEVVDTKVTLFDGSYHSEDSNEMSFQIAASLAFKEAARNANPVVLEPVMSIGIEVPERYVGTVVGDLNRRRGRIEGIEERNGSRVVRAYVPLAAMLGYKVPMPSGTHGQGEFSMHFARYEPIRRNGGSGDDEAGVAAYKPKGPGAGRGSASTRFDREFE
jgi:elongation factor G